jgi:hypothetical protein
MAELLREVLMVGHRTSVGLDVLARSVVACGLDRQPPPRRRD